MVMKSACKSGSGMQTANKHVRDVVAMSGKAGSEGNARPAAEFRPENIPDVVA